MVRSFFKPVLIFIYEQILKISTSSKFSPQFLKALIKQPEKESWDTEYLNNKWEYLKGLEQISRYGVLIEYMIHFKKQEKFLDVGCGEGILFNRFKVNKYSKYVGIDISKIAIDKLNKKTYENTIFLQADAEKYLSDEKFNVIVFNESVYYFSNPLGTRKKYENFLERDGVIIISTSAIGNRYIAV